MSLPTQLSFSQFSGFDWFLVMVCVVSMLLALRRGIIRVVFSLLGLAAGVVVAGWNFARLAHWLQQWISSAAVAQVVAFAVIVFGVMLLFGIAAAVVRRGAKAVGLGFADRLLGAAFGLLRGVLLGVVAMMAIAAFFPRSGWLDGSRLAPFFMGGAHAISFVVPKHFREQISGGASHLLQKTPDLFVPSLERQRP